MASKDDLKRRNLLAKQFRRAEQTKVEWDRSVSCARCGADHTVTRGLLCENCRDELLASLWFALVDNKRKGGEQAAGPATEQGGQTG